MAALDWIMVAILLVSLVLGAARGLVYEVLSLLGWVAAFVLAQRYASALGQRLPIDVAGESLRYALGFVLVFVAAALAAGLLTSVVKRMMASVGLSPVDRVLGLLFGLLRGGLVLMVATMAMLMTPLSNASWWTESIGARLLTQKLNEFKPILPPELGQHIR